MGKRVSRGSGIRCRANQTVVLILKLCYFLASERFLSFAYHRSHCYFPLSPISRPVLSSEVNF